MDKIKEIALALLGVAAIASAEPKTEVTVTGLARKDQKPISRIEYLTTGLPGSSLLYGTVEEMGGDNPLIVGRAESKPVKVGPVSLGVTGKYTDVGDPHMEAGVAASYAGHGLFAVGRFFPKQGSIDNALDVLASYKPNVSAAWADKIAADILASWNMDENSGFVRYGANWYANGNIALRLEGKHSGKPDSLKPDYVGAGLQVKF